VSHVSETATPQIVMGMLHKSLIDLEALADRVDEAVETMIIDGNEAVVWPMSPDYGKSIVAMLQEIAERAAVLSDRGTRASRMVQEGPSVGPESA
jgi:hypothetical protein